MERGQAMILTVLAIGSTILGATTIAGLLMMYQIRQATDLKNSAKAIYAADTGIEWALYNFFNPETLLSPPSFPESSGVQYNSADLCFNGGTPLPCSDEEVSKIKAVGTSGGVSRALELNL